MQLLQFTLALAEVALALTQLVIKRVVRTLQLIQLVARFDELCGGLLVGFLQRVARECIQLLIREERNLL